MQKIVPAILTPDPGELQRQLAVLKGSTTWVHVDIMDGRFVPATSVSISELSGIGQFFHLSLHLMVENPENYLEDCEAVAAKRVFFHKNAARDPLAVLSAMEGRGFQKGIALSPETQAEEAVPFLHKADAALVLSVQPGAQGNAFMKEVLDKVAELKKHKKELVCGADGGISKENIRLAFEKGADYVAVGSAIWKSHDPAAALRELESMVA